MARIQGIVRCANRWEFELGHGLFGRTTCVKHVGFLCVGRKEETVLYSMVGYFGPLEDIGNNAP